MAWTYTNDPANSNRDRVRLLIGDTDTNDQQLTDEELDFFLDEEGSPLGAAIVAARALMAKYARRVDKSVGDLRLSYSQRQQHYAELAARLERRRATRAGTPFAGGISKDDKETAEKDSDRVDPHFHRDQFRHPGSDDDDLESDDC